MATPFDTGSRAAISRYRSRERLQADLLDALDRVVDRSPQGAEPDRPGLHAMGLFRTVPSYNRREILRAADRYRSRGRIRKAIREYEKALAADPHDVEVHTKVVPLYIRTGRKDRAKASLRRVIASYEQQGFVDKAIATLRLALKVDRRDLAARMHLADLYLGKALTASALRLLERARRSFRGRHFLKEALAVEEKILSIAPDDFRAQVSKARLLVKAGRGREARELLWRMESQCARKRNRKFWRKTRWLLSLHAPSVWTAWGWFLSFFLSPVPYSPGTRRRVAS